MMGVKEESPFFRLSFPCEETKGVSVIIDSPHSGREYPADFNYTCDFQKLRGLEDAYVDVLCEGLEEHGATVLTARMPRSYIDLSRAENCLDPAMVPGGLSYLPYDTGGNNARSLKAGTGLIFLQSRIANFKIYDEGQEPREQEIASRLKVWEGYHGKLKSLFTEACEKGDTVYHMDLHSCWRMGAKDKEGVRQRRPDIIVHDKFGQSCVPEFSALVVSSLKEEGFDVALNAKPFKGGYIITNYGKPYEGVNSVQIEFVRDLYMDEATLTLHEGTQKVRDALQRLTDRVRDFAISHHGGSTQEPVQELHV